MFKFSMVDITAAIEKISNLLFFLPLISLALFVDVYLVYYYDVAIWQIDFEWLKAHTTSSEIASFIILFVLSYLVAMPLLHTVSIFVLRLSYLSLPPRMIFRSRYLDNSTYISLNTLRDFSIQHNNTNAYKLYEEFRDKHISNEKNTITTKNNCFSIATFMIILLFHSSPLAVYEEIKQLPNFISLPLLGFVWFIFYEIWDEITRDSSYDNYIYLPSFKSWNKEKLTASRNGDVTLKEKV